MNKLNLDKDIIQACRMMAKHIAEDVQTWINQNTTVSVERTILRMLGIDGVDSLGRPLVNAVIDHLVKDADMTKGVAFYMAHAIFESSSDPTDVARRVAEGKLDLSMYQNHPLAHGEVLIPFIEKMMTRVDVMKETRREMLLVGPHKTTPLKYVIVATGNIYEDIKQAISAAKKGADIIAVIRSTGQSLLDYVPYGPTTEGFGGTYATQANFRLMRDALDQVSKEEGRYIRLVNYASGLCMPEIAIMGATERLDMMLNDSLYGIIFRDINMKRTFIDQYFSRVISSYAEIIINTGEDNYLTTSDAFDHAHTVLASQFINEQFAKLAGMKEPYMGLGHAYEIDPKLENSFLYEIAQAEMSREIFPNAPLKYMPPTKHMTGDIFMGNIQDALFNIAAVTTHQSIHLLGMMTEAIHTPFISDRAMALNNANYIETAFKDFGDEIEFKENGIIKNRAKHVLKEAHNLLKTIEKEGLFEALFQGRFAEISRHEDGGKGLHGVFLKHDDYRNPVLDLMVKRMKEDQHEPKK